MGVITTAPLSSGTMIGPIPTTLTLTDPAFLIGHMTCDNRPDVHTVKVSFVTDNISSAFNLILVNAEYWNYDWYIDSKTSSTFVC